MRSLSQYLPYQYHNVQQFQWHEQFSKLSPWLQCSQWSEGPKIGYTNLKVTFDLSLTRKKSILFSLVQILHFRLMKYLKSPYFLSRDMFIMMILRSFSGKTVVKYYQIPKSVLRVKTTFSILKNIFFCIVYCHNIRHNQTINQRQRLLKQKYQNRIRIHIVFSFYVSTLYKKFSTALWADHLTLEPEHNGTL